MKMREIADAAGVSLTAVSLVLNGKPGIGDEKRALVTRLLQENGYQIRPEDAPQRIHAHSNLCFLKYSKHSYLVNGNPGFVTQIMDAAGEECRRHGYNLLVNAFSDFSAINRAELIDTATTGGVILLGTEIEREDLSYFDGLQKPFVIVDNALERLPFSTVTMDNAGAVFEAVEYLRSLGHRKIGFLYNSIPSSNDNARRDAFEAAMHQPGLSYSDDLICRVFPTMDGARKSFGEALDRGIALPTAFLANNDSIALGAMRAMQERGIRVPQDISMIGFDGLPFSAYERANAHDRGRALRRHRALGCQHHTPADARAHPHDLQHPRQHTAAHPQKHRRAALVRRGMGKGMIEHAWKPSARPLRKGAPAGAYLGGASARGKGARL